MIIGVAPTVEAVTAGHIVRLEHDMCEFKRVYVRSEHRQRGIGMDVAGAMIDRARILGYRRAVLDVMPERTVAVALWASLGFRPCPAYRAYPFPMEFMDIDLDLSSP